MAVKIIILFFCCFKTGFSKEVRKGGYAENGMKLDFAPLAHPLRPLRLNLGNYTVDYPMIFQPTKFAYIHKIAQLRAPTVRAGRYILII